MSGGGMDDAMENNKQSWLALLHKRTPVYTAVNATRPLIRPSTNEDEQLNTTTLVYDMSMLS